MSAREMSTKWPSIAAARRHRRAHQVRTAACALTPFQSSGSMWMRSARRLQRSAFIARHIEQPGFRATGNRRRGIPCRALRVPPAPFTETGTGTTMARRMFGATRRPSVFTTYAAARKSSIRAFVHEPMKILSGLIDCIGVFGSSAMYFSARSIASRLTGSFSRSGSGTRPSMDVTISGDVPHVTCGTISAAFQLHDTIKLRTRIGREGAPVGCCLLEFRRRAESTGDLSGS